MTSLFLAMYGNDVSLLDAAFISLFAMIIVFLVLLIISFMIDITAFFINGKSKKSKKSTTTTTKEIDVTPKRKSKNIDVVVIVAAIAAYLGTSVDNVKISKIRRVGQDTTAWSERGLLAQINKL